MNELTIRPPDNLTEAEATTWDIFATIIAEQVNAYLADYRSELSRP